MNPEQVFPVLVGALEACAGLVYWWRYTQYAMPKDGWLAVVWLGYAVACFALAKAGE